MSAGKFHKEAEIILPKLRSRRGTAALITLALFTAAILGIRAWLFADLPSVEDLSGGLHRPSIRITDRYGRPLYEVIGDEEGRHAVVSLEEIPQACIDATIATEDRNFYTNPGVEPAA